MRIAFILSLLFITTMLLAQSSDTVQIIHKQGRQQITKDCYFDTYWDEIAWKDSAITHKINDGLRGGVSVDDQDTSAYCDSSMGFSGGSRIVFAKHNFVSCETSSSTYMQGAAHGWEDVSTTNFNLKTGKLFKFNDLFDPKKISDVDTLVMHKLEIELKDWKEYEDFDTWRPQLENLDFNMSDKGIDIVFRGDMSVISIMGVTIPYDELKLFMGKKGLLNLYYEAQK